MQASGQTASGLTGAPRPAGMSDEQWAQLEERRRREAGQARVVVNPNQNSQTNAMFDSMTAAQLEQVVE